MSKELQDFFESQRSGRLPVIQPLQKADGTQTEFSAPPFTKVLPPEAYTVFLDGQYQQPGESYSTLLNTIIFKSPPPPGTLVQIERRNIQSVLPYADATHHTLTLPDAGMVSPALLQTLMTDALYPRIDNGVRRRSLAERFGDSVNVMDYGAVADGLTDDAPAFQKALLTGKPVMVPAGKYLIASKIDVEGVDSIYMKALGHVELSLKGSVDVQDDGIFAGATQTRVFNLRAPKVVVDGFVFNGNNSWVYAVMDILDATEYAEVMNCTFKDLRYLSLDQNVNNLSSALRFANCNNFSAIRCNFFNVYHKTLAGDVLKNAELTNGEKLGRAIDNGGVNSNGLYQLCKFYQTRTTAVITGDNAHITMCNFREWTDNAIYDLGSAGSKFTFNEFETSSDEGIVTSGRTTFIVGNNFYDISNKCIAFNGACDRYVIANNTFRGQNVDLVAIVQRVERNDPKYPVTQLTVANNVFLGTTAGYAIIYLFYSRNINIVGNQFIVDNKHSGSPSASFIKVISPDAENVVAMFNNIVVTKETELAWYEAKANTRTLVNANMSTATLQYNTVLPVESKMEANMEVQARSEALNLEGADVRQLIDSVKGAIHLRDLTNVNGSRPTAGMLITAQGDENDFSGTTPAHMGAFGLAYENDTHADNSTQFVVYVAENDSQTLRKVAIIHSNGDMELLLPGAGITAKSPDGSVYRLAPVNGGGTATWTLVPPPEDV